MHYIICSCPRSGSTLLSESLCAMGIGNPEEYLNPLVASENSLVFRTDFMQPSPQEYIKRIKAENSRNGVFGVKTHYIHLARHPEIHDNMNHYFPDAKYISITRRRLLRQAISSAKATQSYAWRLQQEQKKKPVFSYFSVFKHILIMAQEIELWELFYAKNNIKPYRIIYEDLAEDYYGTMGKVLEFLGIENRNIPEPPIKKQADSETDEWVRRSVSVFRGNGLLSRLARFVTKRF